MCEQQLKVVPEPEIPASLRQRMAAWSRDTQAAGSMVTNVMLR